DRGRLELGRGVLALEQDRGGRQQPLDLTVDDHRVEPFLAAEVLVDDWLGDARLSGDLLDRGALEPTLREQPPPDLQELLSALLPGHAPFAWSRRGLCHRFIMSAMPPACQPGWRALSTFHQADHRFVLWPAAPWRPWSWTPGPAWRPPAAWWPAAPRP